MVEEDQFRTTYRSVNERRCIFEKAILSRRCACMCATCFYLADREGAACDAEQAHRRCLRLIALLRESAKFALKITAIEGELPHAKEIKVQAGGLLGLQKVLKPESDASDVADIAALVALGERSFGTLENFPYQEIVKSIIAFEGRRRPRSRH